MKIAVIGTGYVGLVSAACFAELGHDVLCHDLDTTKVDLINNGQAPIHEKGLPELLKHHAGTLLKATENLETALEEAQVIFVACGTPFDGDQIDLSQVESAVAAIGASLQGRKDYPVVVIKSTVVPGTTRTRVMPLLEKSSAMRVGESIGLAVNPEFLREGCAVQDFSEPDRIVIGTEDPHSGAVMEELYRHFSETPVIKTDFNTAELIKYSTNTLLATLISFSNELFRIGSGLGGFDRTHLLHGLYSDKRFVDKTDDGHIGLTTYLDAGPGFGGSCFPKDVKALAGIAKSIKIETPLLDAVLDINQQQATWIIQQLVSKTGALNHKSVAVLGLAFKPHTDDVRESPALRVIEALQLHEAEITVHDPICILPATLKGTKLTRNLDEALRMADVVIVITAWPEYQSLPDMLQKSSKTPYLFDPRGLYSGTLYPSYVGIDQ